MLEDNEMQFIVDALNVMPDRSVLAPKFFSYPTDKRGMAEIRHILTKAINATDKPLLYQITVYGATQELVINRNNDRPSPAEWATMREDSENRRLSSVDPVYLERYAEYWERREAKEKIAEELLKGGWYGTLSDEDYLIAKAIMQWLLDQDKL